jgi:hypothetical protein
MLFQFIVGLVELRKRKANKNRERKKKKKSSKANLFFGNKFVHGKIGNPKKSVNEKTRKVTIAISLFFFGFPLDFSFRFRHFLYLLLLMIFKNSVA